MLLLFTCSPKKWIFGALECAVLPHLIFIVHFVFFQKNLHTVCSLCIICIIVMKIESFFFSSVSFFHGASITLTD